MISTDCRKETLGQIDKETREPIVPKKSSGALVRSQSLSVPGQRGPRRRDLPRVPLAAEGIQSNHCRNVACDNFGVEPLADVSLGAVAKNAVRVQDGYRIVSHNRIRGGERLLCTKCGQYSSIKSNEGIREELARISAYLNPAPEASPPAKSFPLYFRQLSD